jgi:protoheme IX farnesyltransferase
LLTDSLSTGPGWRDYLRDYLEMCKPRVVLLMLLCAIVGMCLATPGMISVDLLITTIVGIALVAGSAAVVNHIADAEIDARMSRTQARPVARGRVSVRQGVLFSAVLGATGGLILYHGVNPLTAWLNLASWVGYGLIYTLYLKRATPQNIVIGGLFGAAPPLFGWTAVTNSIEPGALLLVLIIFVWTPPHFWALALERKDEYQSVNVTMLPVTHGEVAPRWYILAYIVGLLVASVLPFVIGMSGHVYLLGALLLGGRFLYWGGALIRNRADAPMATFRYSILYLMLLFSCLLLDHYLAVAGVF